MPDLATGPRPPIPEFAEALDRDFARLAGREFYVPERSPDFERLLTQEKDFERLLKGTVKFDGATARIEGKWVGKVARGVSRTGAGAALRILGDLGLLLEGIQVIDEVTAAPFEELQRAMVARGAAFRDSDVWVQWASQFDVEQVKKELWKIRQHEKEMWEMATAVAVLTAKTTGNVLKTKKRKRYWRMTRRKNA